MFQHQELKGSVELLEVVTGLRSRAEHRREQRIALQGRNVVISQGFATIAAYAALLSFAASFVCGLFVFFFQL